MTKQKFINLVLTRINGGEFTTDVWKKAHPQIVESYVELALNDIFFQIFKDTNNYDLFAKWIFDIEVKPLQKDLYYSEVPFSLMQTPMKGNAIIRITPTEDLKNILFLPSSVTEVASLSRLGTSSRNGVISWNISESKVLFYNHSPYVTKVNMFVVRPVSDYDLDEDLPIPAGSGDAVFTFVLKYLQSNVPEKSVQDGNPDN